MSLLTFSEFFRAVHGYEPFPWQTRAADLLAKREAFGVAVPTGLGKSALIDAAVWAAAQGAWRRIAFVVDRRIVVDAVHQRATRISEVLRTTQDPRLREFAARLGEMQVVRLRGGVFGDDDWVLFPDRLTIALSTVDQVGSRLLFRGYGVSPRRWPMHAAFFSSDTLVVVDEAHLSNPFVQTLDALRSYGADVAVVPMTATPTVAPGTSVVRLDAVDLSLDVVVQRMRAKKLARLVEVGGSEEDFTKAVAEQVAALSTLSGVTRLAVVTNRVASARRCFERLRQQGTRCTLLTGRVRPADRDAQLAALLPEVEAGRPKSAADSLLVVVATQTIEVGADFDFDALITECAPLASLRQRFGRLDRLGTRGLSQAAILHRAPKDKEDPVYGAGLEATWEWLIARSDEAGGAIDFGLDSLGALLDQHPPTPDPIRHAATLLPTHVQMLAQTGPFAPLIDVSSWLHGATDMAPDVTVVWRDDLVVDAPEQWPLSVTLLAPMLREGLTMPAPAIRRLFCGAKPGDQWSDKDVDVDDTEVKLEAGLPELRWRGGDDCAVISAREIRPGDTLVVPAAYGGCDEWGWAPESKEPVRDLADACALERHEAGAPQRISMRLAAGHLWTFGEAAADVARAVTELLAVEEAAVSSDDDMTDEIEEARLSLVQIALGSGHPLAKAVRSPRLDRLADGFVLRGTGVEEVEGVLETGKAVELSVHHRDVARWAGALAASDPSREQIIAAAAVHDAGKAEPRMQALLHGHPLLASLGPVLAKSAAQRRDLQVAAWIASGVPRGFRHEFASLEYETIQDPLTKLLVATHHGFGRPWLPPCHDAAAAGARYARLNAHWGQTWSSQLNQHGAWGLARMEWLVRAADARASIEEAQVAEGGPDA